MTQNIYIILYILPHLILACQHIYYPIFVAFTFHKNLFIM